MKEPVRLDVYRERPKPVPLRCREHAPVCTWCRWAQHNARERALVCEEPSTNPASTYRTLKNANGEGQCNNYAPSFWTRILQALRLKPFVERSRKQKT